MVRNLFLAIVACAAVGLGAPAGAGPLVVDRREPVEVDARFSGDADVAAGNDGGYLVVWWEGLDQSRVMARAFDATGVPRGAARHIGGGSRGYNNSRLTRVAAVGDGRFVVAWIETGRVGIRLWLRLVDAAGTPLGVAVDAGAADAADAPVLVVGEDRMVTVASTISRSTQLRRFDASRVDLPAVPWHADAGGGGYLLGLGGTMPAMAIVPDGLIVARAGGFGRINVLVLDAEGRVRAERVLLTAPPGFEYGELRGVRLTVDESARLQLVWHELFYAFGTTSPLPIGIVDRIRMQELAADGSPLAEPVDLVSGPADLAHPELFLSLGDAEARRDRSLLLTWSLGHHAGAVCGGPSDRLYECPLYAAAVDGDLRATVFAADGAPLAEAVVGPGSPVAYPGGAAVAGGAWLTTYHDPDVKLAKVSLAGCGESAATLCLADRFRVSVEWRTDGDAGEGMPQSVTADTGAFWFFSPKNVEMLVKVLDGTAINGKHWVFFASLTDVEFDLVVTDTATGAVKRYHNPQGTLASRADTEAFGDGASFAAVASRMSAGLGVALERAPAAVAAADTASPCPAGALCLAEGRFVVTAKWRLEGPENAATPIAWTGETGAFWFFSRSNVELAVKVLDGRGVNGHFWVLFASLSDVDFDLEVLDTTTGARRTYHNPRGTMASRADVEAF